MNGGLRRALLWSLAGPRSDTPAHRESGLMSWHGRFGRAVVNLCSGAGRCHESCARGSKDGRMDHQMGADGLLPALRGCHVRRWRWFIKTRRNRCRSRNCLREGVSAFFITVGAGNGPVAADGTSAPRVYPLGYRRILALIKFVPCEARAGP